MKLEIGQPAPDFEAVASNGQNIRISDFKGQKAVVLFFYPKDFTTVCTAEVCGFRDLYSELQGKDVEVIGVSTDPDASHRKFAEQHKIQYPLLADTDRAISSKYGATNFILNMFGSTKRMTFVIDKEGKIAASFDALLSAGPHLEGVKGLLNKLAAS